MKPNPQPSKTPTLMGEEQGFSKKELRDQQLMLHVPGDIGLCVRSRESPAGETRGLGMRGMSGPCGAWMGITGP